MTPAEFTEARQALGLKRSELARVLRTTARSIRGWENDGDTQWREIPFAIAMLMTLAVKSAMVRRALKIHGKGEQAAPRRSPGG